MSATSNAAATGSRVRRRDPGGMTEPAVLRVVELAGTAGTLALIVWAVSSNWPEFSRVLRDVLPWIVVVAAADLMPVPIWRSVELMMSFPVLLASAFVFPPFAAGCLSFAATLDVRELRREIPVARALFNRSNVALSVMAASWVFHTMGGVPLNWPDVLPIGFVSMIVDLLINGSLVILGTRLLTGLPPMALIQNVYGGSQPLAFLGAYASFGLLAVVLATVYKAAGTWGLVAFAIPLLLARQMFVHWKSLTTTQLQLSEERRLLSRVSSRIAEERRDERLAVAAGIHDDVLPPIYKVHLMGQVLRQDLASGRLLDLEADLPDLLQATEAASEALRDLINDLRRSTLGPGGIVQTLELLSRGLSVDSGIPIEVSAGPVPGTPLTHLLVYQVAREALTNAVQHSGARTVRVVLEAVSDGIRLQVEDDGVGFEPALVDGARHFGLQLMRERIELAGGSFYLESAPGGGTRVVVKVPVER